MLAEGFDAELKDFRNSSQSVRLNWYQFDLHVNPSPIN